jgi:hypothetical protein
MNAVPQSVRSLSGIRAFDKNGGKRDVIPYTGEYAKHALTAESVSIQRMIRPSGRTLDVSQRDQLMLVVTSETEFRRRWLETMNAHLRQPLHRNYHGLRHRGASGCCATQYTRAFGSM